MDAKAGVLIAAQIALLTVALPELATNRDYLTDNWPLCAGILIEIVLSAISSYYGIRCILPRLNVGQRRSLLFFAHIAESFNEASTGPEQFAAEAGPHYNDQAAFDEAILHQIWANSRVAWDKTKDTAYCFRTLIVQGSLALLLFIYSFFCT